MPIHKYYNDLNLCQYKDKWHEYKYVPKKKFLREIYASKNLLIIIKINK